MTDSYAHDFDVIIVGAGSAGGALAARLSENDARSVLLLEAGPAYQRLEDFPEAILDPANISNAIPGGAWNWNLLGAATEKVQLPIPRGKVMGGSSSINGAYFIRGVPADFDLWAAQGNDEWSYEKVLPFFKRSERDLDFDNELHGQDGPIAVKREPQDRAPEFTNAFTAACRALGFDEEPDKNGEGRGGVGPVPLNIDKRGYRMGTALGYLLPNLGRPNLTLLGDAVATRLLFTGTTCTGVEASVHGKLTRFNGREVVLSTGTLRSPQLLMLSGIGPERHLREHGIEVRAGLPGVGQHLTDHPELAAPWTFNGKCATPPRRGIMTSSLNWSSEQANGAQDLEILPFVTTPAAMLKLPGMARHPVAAIRAARMTGFKEALAHARMARIPIVVLGLMQEKSRGTVTLASGNPADPPALTYNLLSDPNDRPRFRELVKTTVELFNAKPIREIGGSLVGLDGDTVAEVSRLDEWIDTHLFALGHPSCTCKMGPSSDDMAVVDQYGRVHGVENLRVCDQSIYPEITSRGPNATTTMIGERMSAFFD